MHNNKENEDEASPAIAVRVKRVLHIVAHKTHSVSEFFHIGYFATAAGLMHEFHSVFAAACGAALVIVIVAGGVGVEGE